jgi:orotate phosphoribosyltransferase
MRDEVVLELARFGYYYRPDQPFRLSSGQSSPEYLDCRAALARPRVLEAAGQLVLDALIHPVRSIGGLTMGADPLAVAASMRSFYTHWQLPRHLWWFSVRKEPKGHGPAGGEALMSRFVGALTPGDDVAIVDDVATTGASTISAIRACRAAYLRVRQAIVLVDRQQGGLAAIQSELDTLAGNTAKVSALITLDEVRAAWRVLNPEP